MKPRWSVSDEVPQVFHAATRAERERLLSIFTQLAAFPSNRADYVEQGNDGRLYNVALVDSWLVTYWMEVSGEILRVVELEAAF